MCKEGSKEMEVQMNGNEYKKGEEEVEENMHKSEWCETVFEKMR